MDDTTPEFRRLVHERWGAIAPAERVRMCAEMFETARRIVEASLPAGLDPQERRYRICRRFYGELADRAFGRGSFAVRLPCAPSPQPLPKNRFGK